MKSNKKIIFLILSALIIILAALLFSMRQKDTGGETIAREIDRIEDVKGLGYSGQRKIAIDTNGDFFVAYRKKYQGKSEIFVAKATYFKNDWSISGTMHPISAVGSAAEQRVPSMAIDSKNNIHVVWYGSDSNNQINNRQIKYSRSGDEGKSWSNRINISYVDGYESNEGYWQEHPHILAGASDYLFIVWEGKDKNNQNQQIKFSRSSDDGKTWSYWKNIQVTPDNTQSRPTLIQDKNNRLHLFMYSTFGSKDGKQTVQYSFSDDSGDSWSAWKTVSDINYDSRHVTAAADLLGKIHVAWRMQDQSGYSQIIKRTLENGTWSEMKSIAISQNYQFFPSIGVSADGQTAVVWMESDQPSDLPQEDPKNGKVYISMLNSGALSPPKEISSQNGGLYPQIPEVFGKDGIPIIYESVLSSGSYGLIFQLIK